MHLTRIRSHNRRGGGTIKGHFKTKRVQNPLSVRPSVCTRPITGGGRRSSERPAAAATSLLQRKFPCSGRSFASLTFPGAEEEEEVGPRVRFPFSLILIRSSKQLLRNINNHFKKRKKKITFQFFQMWVCCFSSSDQKLNPVCRIQSFSSKLESPDKIFGFSSPCEEQSENWGEKNLIWNVQMWKSAVFWPKWWISLSWFEQKSSDNQLKI